MKSKADIGKDGERFCASYFEKLGYKIISCNYHSRFGEIDVIAENEKFLVFAEVKTRSESRIAEAREAVTPAKQKKIMLTALDFISKKRDEKQIRFDVFEVLVNENGRIYKFRNIENAFDFDESLIY